MTHPDEQGVAVTQGDRHSPNLARWLKRHVRFRTALVYRDENGALMIGRMDSDGWFTGTRLMHILCDGLKATVFAYPPALTGAWQEQADFWPRYEHVGRCAVDPEHRMSFIGDETRWQTDGDERHCLWCGECNQRLRRWTKSIDCKAWESLPATTLANAEVTA